MRRCKQTNKLLDSHLCGRRSLQVLPNRHDRTHREINYDDSATLGGATDPRVVAGSPADDLPAEVIGGVELLLDSWT